MARLAKVVDTDPDGSTGEAEIVVPQAWLDDRAIVEVTLPIRLRCHDCHGGGCDACGRSGVHRLPEEIDARTLQLPLPPEPSVLRLNDPVDAGQPKLVRLNVRLGEPSDSVRRLSPEKPKSVHLWWLLAAVLAGAIVVTALFVQ